MLRGGLELLGLGGGIKRPLGRTLCALAVSVLLGACGDGVTGQAAEKTPHAFAKNVPAVASAVSVAGVGSFESTERAKEIDVRFKQAAAMLHIRQYRYAATALHRVLELAPDMPEAHVNMGYAMLGMERYVDAAESFNKAIRLKSSQANAYYGLALASYNTGDSGAAINALNNFIRLSPPGDPHVSKARSALAEWRKAGTVKSADKLGKRG